MLAVEKHSISGLRCEHGKTLCAKILADYWLNPFELHHLLGQAEYCLGFPLCWKPKIQ